MAIKKTKFVEKLIVDAALAKICARPCGPHYYYMQYFYWNYTKSSSHRGFSQR